MPNIILKPPGRVSHVHAGAHLLTARADGNFEVPSHLVADLVAMGFSPVASEAPAPAPKIEPKRKG